MNQRQRGITRKRELMFLAASVIVGVVALCGCPGGNGPAPIRPQVSQFTDASGRTVRDTNNNGIPDLPLDARPTVFSSFSGFTPGQLVELQVLRNGAPITDPTTGEPIVFQVTADRNGNIPPIPIWDIGVGPDGQPIDASGTYEIRAVGSRRGVLAALLKFEILPLQRASRQVGYAFVNVLAGSPPRYPMGSVLVGEPVLVEGFGLPANRQVKLFVVRDKDNWQSGDQLTDQSGGAETTQTDTNGNLPQTQVWASAQRLGERQTDGDFDVIVDVNANDRFDSGTDVVVFAIGTGFTVQAASRGRQAQHLAVELAASQQGQFKDEFNVDENVSVWLNPPWRPMTPYQMVRKYIVLHKDEWQDGDVLVDVTGRPEWDIMRFACANQYAYPVWIGPLTPSKYDVIIDMNNDGRYTLGTDYIDAFSQTPQGVCGFVVLGTPPPVSLALSAIPPAINANERATILAQVKFGDRFVNGATVNFSIIAGQGGQLSSNSATTDQSGIATVTLTATQPDQNIVVRASVTHAGQSAQTDVTVRVRALGELGLIIRQR
ncbi:MAG: hypothetical protein NZ937_04120 [Armatimonadetes bacterium]|nr:hypothetical protein [Armatimonadota bacterium]